MKRLAILLVLAGCAGLPMGSRSITVVVQSENWDASSVALYCDSGQQLRPEIRGLMRGERRERTYSLPGGCFQIRTKISFAGGKVISPRPEPVQDGDTLFVMIPPYVDGAALGSDQQRAVVLDATPQSPLAMHLGVYVDISGCLGIPTRSLAGIEWFTARQIIMSDGSLAYGMTAINESFVATAIVIQDGFWLDIRVWSHELIHLATGDPTHDNAAIWQCVMNPRAIDLPRRTAHPDTIAKYFGPGSLSGG